MTEHFRRPSDEHMRRGRLLIDALSKEIYVLTQGEPFRDYPNWRTDYTDYMGMLREARRVMAMGVRITIDAAGFGGVGGTQVVVLGRIVQSGAINSVTLIDRAVANIHAKEQRTKGVSSEEMREIIARAEREGQDIDAVWQSEVIPRLPRAEDQIRLSLLNKIFPNT